MADLARIMAPLGAECDPDDTINDILLPLSEQHPLPMVVVRDGEVIASIRPGVSSGFQNVCHGRRGLVANSPR